MRSELAEAGVHFGADGGESIMNEWIDAALGVAGLHGTLDTAADQAWTQIERLDHGIG